MNKIICSNCGTDNYENAKYCSRCGQAIQLPASEVIPGAVTEPVEQTITGKINKRKTLFGSLFGIIVFGLACWAVQHYFSRLLSFDTQMIKAAVEINKSCPIMIDEHTRLDNALAMPGNVFQYNYTLVDLEQSAFNPEAAKEYIEPGIINNVKTSPDLKIYRDHKTTMVYNYRDKNGAVVYTLSVTPDMYE